VFVYRFRGQLSNLKLKIMYAMRNQAVRLRGRRDVGKMLGIDEEVYKYMFMEKAVITELFLCLFL
jgi:hypothetical protein